MSDLEFFLEHGVTPETFNAMTIAAKCLVNSGDLDQLTVVLFNQIVNHCSRIGSDHSKSL